MQLTLWTYEGPPHVGAMRIATAMRDVHYVLHAPQGDTYADLLFTMIERRQTRPPVTYTTFQARDLGGDTAELFKTHVRARPTSASSRKALMVGASCTAELIQDDPGGLAAALGLPMPVIPLELPAYQRKENWGAAETFYQLVRALAGAAARPPGTATARRARAAPALQPARAHRAGLPPPRRRARDQRLLDRLGIDVNVVRAARRHARRPGAPDRGRLQRRALPRDRRPGRRLAAAQLRQPRTTVVPIGAAPRASSSPRWRAGRHRCRSRCWLAADVARPGIALGRLHLPHRQARVRLRRRHACHRRRPRRRAGDGLHRRRPGHLQPRVRARGARGRQALRRRGADHRRLPRGRGASPSCSPSWCWARRWNATSPSAWACPAR
jgi:hypothetical protein